jgi:hypothetical protein
MEQEDEHSDGNHNRLDQSSGESSISAELQKLFNRIYYDPSKVGSYGGVRILQDQVNALLLKAKKSPISKRVVETWLSSQPTYVLHKRVAKNTFERNPIILKGPGDLFMADLVVYSDIPSYNYKYLLVVMDAATRYVWYRYLKTKKCSETFKKIKEILAQVKPVSVINLMTDKGGELNCAEMKEYMKTVGINLYSKHSGDYKTPHLDRFIRTINERLHRWFYKNASTNWVLAIPKLMASQNSTVNRVIGMSPRQAWSQRLTHDMESQRRQIEPARKVENVKYKVGDRVSIWGGPVSALS